MVASAAGLAASPRCTLRSLRVDRCGVSRQTASAWLHAFTDGGAVVEVRRGREVLFRNTAFLEVLTRPST